MPDPVALASLVVSVAALGVSYRSSRRSDRAIEITEEEHRQRQAERAARPVLAIEIHPSNVTLDDDAVIRTDASAIYVNLAIKVANLGQKPAGRTHVEVWVPSFIDSPTLKWMDPSGGEENRLGHSAPDATVRLETGDGRLFDTQRMTRTLDAVPLVGETLYLRIQCPVADAGDAMIPVRVRARTDGSEAETTYPIQLRRAQP